MFYLRFALVGVLLVFVPTTTGQLLARQSNSVAMFAPTFSPDFEDVVIESPPDSLFGCGIGCRSDGANLVDLAMSLPSLPAATAVSEQNPGINAVSRESRSGCADCQSCQFRSAESMKSHCQLMAKLLSFALHEGDQTREDQCKVIEAALMMIAETSEAKAQARISRLEVIHQKQLTGLQHPLKNSPETNSVSQFREWLGPIYTNQNRNFHQMQSLATNSQNLNRTVRMLERKIEAAKPWTPPQKIQNQLYSESDSSGIGNRNRIENAGMLEQRSQNEVVQRNRIDSSEQANQLRQEIHDLQQRLKVLQQEAVRPVNHLEPVFTPDQPLKPLYQRR